MRRRPEKGEAPTAPTVEASSEANPIAKESNVEDSTETAAAVAITPETMPSITWEGARVITTELLARLYGASAKQIHDGFQYHHARFELGKHYYRLEKDELRAFRDYPGNSGVVAPRTRQLIVWTERGAARHAKMLETDAAWEVFERLEDCYFKVKEIMERAAYSVNPDQTLSAEQAETLRLLLTENVKKLPKAKQGGAMVKGWSKLKAHFKTDYRHIPAGEFHEAVNILARHVAEWELVDEKPQTDAAHAGLNPTDSLAMKAARDAAMKYLNDYRSAVAAGAERPDFPDVPGDVLAGILADAMMRQHFLLSFDWSTGGMRVTPVDEQSVVVDPRQGRSLRNLLTDMLPMDRVPEALQILTSRVDCHLGTFRERLQRDRAAAKQTAPGVLQRA